MVTAESYRELPDNSASSHQPAGGLLAELRDASLQFLNTSLPKLFTLLDDELFKRSETATSNVQQTLYFETMRLIRVESATLQARSIQAVLRAFDEMRQPTPGARPSNVIPHPAQHQQPSLAEDDFSLVDNDSLEQDLAVNMMVEKGNQRHQRDLFALNRRLAMLVGLDQPDESRNPVAPRCLVEAFATTLAELQIELPARLLILKLFDQAMIESLGELYLDLNERLREAGILPNLPRDAKSASRPAVSRPTDETAKPDAWDAAHDEPPHAYLEMFDHMQRMLEGWRAQMGLQSLSGIAPGATSFKPAEVMSALTEMQRPDALAPPLTTEHLKTYIQDQLARAVGQSDRPLARAEEDIIDMVAIIFDFILGDRNLPDAVKGLIARLQIPVIKVAILEKAFFGRKNHPVRQLLNALAQAGAALDASEAVGDNATFQKIEKIVDRILNDFDQNVAMFQEILDEFTAFLEKEAQRSRVTEERTRQVTQSREQLQLAKHKVAFEIASRLHVAPTPAPVRAFLYNTWKDVMILACLRREKSEDDWQRCLAIMDRLIWSVTASAEGHSRKELIMAIPPLLKAIRSGLETIALDPQGVATAIKSLESCHVERLSHVAAAPKLAEAAAVPETLAEPAESVEVEVRDPEMARVLNEISRNLPDIDNFSVEDLSAGLLGGTGDGITVRVDDAAMLAARDLKLGDWMDFFEGRKRLRAKLSWRSQVTSTHVFVNRRGNKVLEIPLADLAIRLSDGSAKILDGMAVPIMDRALNALMNTLKGPEMTAELGV